MSKMRIYQYAKQKQLKSKDVLAELQALGISVKSHMSVIEDETINKLNQRLQSSNDQSNQKQSTQQGSKQQGSKKQTKRQSQSQQSAQSHQYKQQTHKHDKQQQSSQTQSTNKQSSSQKRQQHQSKPKGRAQHQQQRPQSSGKQSMQQRKNSQYSKSRKKKNFHRNNKKRYKKQARPEPQPAKVPDKITFTESLTVAGLAEKLRRSSSDIIKKLMGLGVMATKNQELSKESIELIADEYGAEVEEEHPVDITDFSIYETEEQDENLQARPPVVTMMGHVDHGKTTLLDAIRHTKVQSGEAGGITQHIGAYQIEENDKKITFLDTPGHAAFTTMRSRGADITDMTILVVAADDGVMPQTVEAVNHAKAAGVPIIVAVNKMDAPGANPDRVMQELAEHELIPEDWGGDTIFVRVSAKKEEGIDELIEMIQLVADIEEYQANPDRVAAGTVIEAQLDKGRGPLASLLVQKGTLHSGDTVVVGSTYGKVRTMVNENGRRVHTAVPSTPVEITGLNNVPEAGDPFLMFADEKKARQVGEARAKQHQESQRADNAKVSLDDLFAQIQQGDLKEINVIVKADVQGSVEALASSLQKIEVEGAKLNVIHTGAGAIKESDIILASASNALIVGFNVRPDSQAKKTADSEKVDIRLYRVIYDAINEMEAAMKGMLDPVYEEQVIGQVEVRKTFKVSRIGTIAGSYVTDGKITRNSKARLIRDGVVKFDGNLDSLKRFKEDTKEVQSGYECGITLEKFNDIKEGDVIEAYIMAEIERK